jgi:hypothetical protein
MLITKDSIKLGDKQLVGVAMIRKIRFSSLPPVRFFAFSLKCQSRRKGRKLVVGPGAARAYSWAERSKRAAS